jgi:hypothetical protein
MRGCAVVGAAAGNSGLILASNLFRRFDIVGCSAADRPAFGEAPGVAAGGVV